MPKRNFFDIETSSERSARNDDDVEREERAKRPRQSDRAREEDDRPARRKRARNDDERSARRKRARDDDDDDDDGDKHVRRRRREQQALVATAPQRPAKEYVRASHIPSLDDDDDDDLGRGGCGLAGIERRVVDYRRPFVELLRVREQAEATRIDQLRPRGRLDFLYDVTDGYRVDTRALGGWQRLARLQYALTSFDEAIAREQGTSGRSPDQKWFHRKMTIAVLPLLFGDELDANLETLQRQFGFIDIHKEVLVITPRRHGKTWSVAMFAAAYAHAMGSSEQAIFSTGRRASEKLLDLVYQFVSKIPGFTKSDVARNNQETLWLRGPSSGDLRKVFSYPSKIEICFPRVRTALSCVRPCRGMCVRACSA